MAQSVGAKTLAESSEAMRDIEFCTLGTRSAGRATPGTGMIDRTAQRLHYWDGEEDGEAKVGL